MRISLRLNEEEEKVFNEAFEKAVEKKKSEFIKSRILKAERDMDRSTMLISGALMIARKEMDKMIRKGSVDLRKLQEIRNTIDEQVRSAWED